MESAEWGHGSPEAPCRRTSTVSSCLGSEVVTHPTLAATSELWQAELSSKYAGEGDGQPQRSWGQ